MLALPVGLCLPELLMIDEPSLGLSPTAITNVFTAIKKIRDTGKSILLVEQNVPRAQHGSLCSRHRKRKNRLAGKSTELRKEFVTRS